MDTTTIEAYKEVFNKANTEEAAHNIDKSDSTRIRCLLSYSPKFDALTVNTMNKYKSFKITDTFDSKIWYGIGWEKLWWRIVVCWSEWYLEKADTGGKLTVSGNTVTYTASDSF